MPEIHHTPRRFREKDFPYFRRLWNSIVVALLVAALIPLLLIGGGMYYYATSALRQKTMELLRTEVRYHKKAIDQFLAERAMDLKQLSENRDLSSLIRQETLEALFQSMQRQLPCFKDLGIIDDEGRHLAYTGPYDLLSKNYQNAEWFQAVMASDVYISDVFMGLRNAPHFIIAVKQTGSQGAWIIRATVDTVFFDNLVSEVIDTKGMDVFLVNRNGTFQTSPWYAGRLMGQSEFKDLKRFKGVRVNGSKGRIRASIWLENVSWLCVVQIDRSEALKSLHRMRAVGVFVFILMAILIVFTVLLTTNHLVERLEAKRQSIRFLDRQLRCTSYLASSMELSYGFFRDIKDTLANIDVACRWMEDLTLKGDLSQIAKSLDQIKSQASRGRKSIDKFLGFIRHGEPMIMEINVNDVLNDLIEILTKELGFKRIKVKRDYQDHLPSVRSDPAKLHQVFQNIVLNAVTAIGKDGEIIFATRASPNGVTVTITDDGPGIHEENMEKIFEPLFTSKQEGTGLGLPICLDILEKLGGTISARSESGKGASFIVELPLRIKSFDLE